MRGRLSRRAIGLVAGAVVALSAAGASPAFAVPGAPTAHIVSGDGFINAAETAAGVTVTGTYPATTPVVDDVVVRIVDSATCDSAALPTTPNLHAVLDGAGNYTAGPFDVSAFAEGATLCARARASQDGGSTYGPLGISDNTPVKDTTVLAGTAEIVDPNADGWLNAAELAAELRVLWGAPSSDISGIVSAEGRFADGAGVTPAAPATCGPFGPLPPSNPEPTNGYLNLACGTAFAERDLISWRVKWTDLAGNTGPEAISNILKKDTLSPIVDTLSIDNDPINIANVAMVEVSGTAHDQAPIDAADRALSIALTLTDGTDVVVDTVLAKDGTFEATMNASSLADSAKDVNLDYIPNILGKAIATDEAGNASALKTEGPVVKDTLAPDLPTVEMTPDRITEPNKTLVEITVDGETRATANLTLDDEDPGTAPLTKTFTMTSPVTVYMDTGSLTDGALLATATLTDLVGNVSGVGSDTGLKRLTTTSVIMTSPATGSLSQAKVTFSGVAAPGANVTVYQKNTDGTQNVLEVATADADGDWAVDHTYSKSGTYTVFARTANGLGSALRTFDVDVFKATAVITSPKNPAVIGQQEVPPVGVEGDLVVEGLTGDDFSGVARVEITVFDTLGKAVVQKDAILTPGGYPKSASFSLDLNSLPMGTYDIYARAIDRAKNDGVPHVVRVIKLA